MLPIKSNSFKYYIYFIRKSVFRLSQVGHFLPSSKALVTSIANSSNLKSAKHIIELGSGTGGTTVGILSEMNKHSQICAIEIDKAFTDYLTQNIKDKRLIVRTDVAQNLHTILKELDWNQVDVIISGIPFSTFPETISREIIQTIFDSLKPGGLFVAYQLKDRVSQLASPLFGSPKIKWEFKNLPPMRIFSWIKP